jgi:signal transduction histidine kinase
MPAPQIRSARILMAALLLTLAGVAAALALALHQPWLGLTLSPSSDTAIPGVVVTGVDRRGPAAALPAGAQLLSLGSGAQQIALQARDLVADPGFFAARAQSAAFLQRQTRIAALLDAPVLLRWREPNGRIVAQTVRPAPQRPLSSLPAVFWFALLCGSAVPLIGAWVYALHPQSWPARALALAGVLFLPYALSAAVYGARELALPANLFALLAAIHHLGALGFGGALVALFLVYPARLVPLRWLWPIPLVVLGWWGADLLRLTPAGGWGLRLALLLEIACALALAVVQWRRSAKRAADRAALRWFMLSAALATFTFAVLVFGAQLFGLRAPQLSGYALGLVVVMYVGLALGVGRYSLFDLDRFAYRVVPWALGLGLIAALGTLLVLLFDWPLSGSLALTLLVAGAAHLPLRRWLWRRMVHGALPPIERLLPEIIAVAFTPQVQERERRWIALLDRPYQPLRNLPLRSDEADAQIGLAQDGMELRVASAGGMAARRLQGRNNAQRLFTTTDAELASALVTLFNQAAAGRDALEAGVQRERDRIASDLHDDIGAKLLTLRHLVHGEREQALLMTTIDQLRAIVRGLRQQVQPWDEFAADLRSETAQRLAAAGIALDWPSPLIRGLESASQRDSGTPAQPPHDAAQQYHLRALLQEAVSNAIRHARASRVSVRLSVDSGARMRLDVIDDGIGIAPQRDGSGHGLTSMQIRARALGGDIRWRQAAELPPSATSPDAAPAPPAPPPATGTWIVLEFPLQPGTI